MQLSKKILVANNKNENIYNKFPQNKKKKKPGRPRKLPIQSPAPIYGIREIPTNKEDSIEIYYDKPLVLKKMMQFLKLMAVEKLQIIFKKDRVNFWAIDHHKKNKIMITLHAKNLNYYYCHEEYDIGLICKDLELVLSKIDKTYYNIIIITKKGNTQKNLSIYLTNDLNIEEKHTIEVIGEYPKLDKYDIFTIKNYTINFTLPGKYFKKMITDIYSFTNLLTICQNDMNESLKFEYVTGNKKIKSTNIVKQPEKIKFESRLKIDESFRISLLLDYIKPISSSNLSKEVMIYCSEMKPVLFVIKTTDETFEARILTEIIDERLN